MDLVQCRISEDIVVASGVCQVGNDVVLCFSPVEMRQDAVHIDTLADSGVSLQFELGIPKFGLSDEYQGHGALGVETVVEKKTEFLQCLFLKQMGLIKNAYDLFMLYSVNDLYCLLEHSF